MIIYAQIFTVCAIVIGIFLLLYFMGLFDLTKVFKNLFQIPTHWGSSGVPTGLSIDKEGELIDKKGNKVETQPLSEYLAMNDKALIEGFATIGKVFQKAGWMDKEAAFQKEIADDIEKLQALIKDD